ncbi:cell division protein FtsQ/DivIB [Flavobacterium pallidum]|uniref:Cell division protein FtsQ n=1 Tax=Flavobacterium pallidum TaxID=2172098 RepID=A0A2S1SE45_9FLAO|nr:cell division protein FtsQ [Flavobacterium pallidum]AWI24644.1 cell division protein FtsQ [Flavobacterium pallidum]
MKKLNWINIWVNVRLLLICIGLISLYSFTLKRNEERKLKASVIEFTANDNLFITREMVNKLLIENKPSAQTIRKENLDLGKLENAINANEMIEKSEVFVSIDGVLKAVVKQKTPIARVVDDAGSFYLDSEGDKMPLSIIHTARVPLVSGVVDENNSKELCKVFRLIHDDDFLKKNIIGIQVLPNGGLIMSNRNFDYQIDFGKPINAERKFNNYKAFFQKAIKDSLLNNYRFINLKFTQQVVCTK